jgi:hypothetical protein
MFSYLKFLLITGSIPIYIHTVSELYLSTMKIIIVVNCTGTIPEQWRSLGNSENNSILNSAE